MRVKNEQAEFLKQSIRKFYKEFGEQKVDIVSFKKDEPSTFKELALLESVKL